MNKLKPCPFCGASDDQLTIEDDLGIGGTAYGHCTRCDTEGPPSVKSIREAVYLWNARIIERTLAALKEIDTFNPLRDDRDMYLSLVADWGMGETDEHPNAAEFGIVQEAT